MNKIEKYLKDYLQNIVFITLKESINTKTKNLDYLKNIPLPIESNQLMNIATDEESIEKIPLTTLVKGMIYIIGIDPEFRSVDKYKKFLYDFDANISNYIIYEGLKLAENKKHFDALIYFKGLLNLEKNNINGMFNYARCCQDIYKKEEDVDTIKDFKQEAIRMLENITIIYPEFPTAYYYLGFHYVNQGLYKKAQLTWESYLKLEDDNKEKVNEIKMQLNKIKDTIQYEEGYTLILNNKDEQGIEKLIPLIEKHPDWWNAMFFVGLGYRKLSGFEEAIKYFNMALLVKPSQSETINELGLCYTSLKDYAKAEKYFKKAITLKGDDPELLCNLGIVYMEKGDLNLAKEMFEKSVNIDPNDYITNQCLIKIKKAQSTKN